MTLLEEAWSDMLLAFAADSDRRCLHALPVSVRISEKLGEMLIAVSELQADLATDEAGVLREILPVVDEVAARIDVLLKKFAA